MAEPSIESKALESVLDDEAQTAPRNVLKRESTHCRSIV